MGDRVTVERRVPVGALATVGAVLALALGSGVTVFVGVGLLCWGVGWPVAVALVLAGASTCAVWVVVVLRFDVLLFATETQTQIADQVDQIAPVETVRVEVSDVDAGRWSFLDLPGDVDELADFARAVLMGTRSLSEADWTGAGRPYSKNEYRSLRAQLLERGLVGWRNSDAPSQGCELTRVGRHVFSRLADPHARTHAHATGAALALTDGPEKGGSDYAS